MALRTHFSVLSLLAICLSTVSLVGAQETVDICPLAVRLSSARVEHICLEQRQLPFPAVAPTNRDSTWLILPFHISGSYRSSYPSDRNNGANWTGRGLSSSLSGGIRKQWGRITLALEPDMVWAQNLSFMLPDTTTPGFSRHSYPWGNGRLDRFMRPGGGSMLAIDPGRSFVEVSTGPLVSGVSTEPLWWGPARRYPLLFSGTSGGFPHFYNETKDFIESPLGGFSTRILWGILSESDWYDSDSKNNKNLLGALQLQWRIDFIPGFELVYSLVRHEPLLNGDLDPSHLSQLIAGDPQEEGIQKKGTSMGTFGFRLSLPKEGFEAYAEIGWGDGFLNPPAGVSDISFRDIYMLGFGRTITTTSGNRWRLSGEIIKQAMGLPQPSKTPSTGTHFTPRRVTHGHTHRGQLIGASIGPGSNAQYLALDWFGSKQTLGIFAERTRRDDDTYLRIHAFDYGFRGHDLEWTLGIRSGRSLGKGAQGSAPLSLGTEVSMSRRKNRDFVGLDHGHNRVFYREWNLLVDLYLRWSLPTG